MFPQKNHRQTSEELPLKRSVPLVPDSPRRRPMPSLRDIDLSKAEIKFPDSDRPLSDSEMKLFSKMRAESSRKSIYRASSITIPMTAAGYWYLNTKAPGFWETMAIITPTIGAWWGIFLKSTEKWRKTQIKSNPRMKKFFEDDRFKANRNKIVAGELVWYGLRTLCDPALIFLSSKFINDTRWAAAAGGLASHSLLAFYVWPKHIMHRIGSLFDQKKQS